MQRPYISFIVALVPLATFFMGALCRLGTDGRRLTLEMITAQEARPVRNSVQLMNRDFAPVVGNLRILADGDPLLNYLAAPVEGRRENLARHFILFTRERHTYAPIRLLGLDRRELVRVDDTGEKVTDVPGSCSRTSRTDTTSRQRPRWPPGRSSFHLSI